MINYLIAFATALRDEVICLRLFMGYLPWRVWLVLGLLLTLALAAPWLGSAATGVSGSLVLAVGLLMVFSSRVSAWGRKGGWLPGHVPIVVAFLPQLISLLLLPIYMVCLAGFFFSLSRQFPGTLPADGMTGSLLLTVDVVSQAAVFLDLFEVFHIRAGGDPASWVGSLCLFVPRLLLDITLIELLARTLYAASYRAQGLGRGEDKLFRLKEALENQDAAETRGMAESVGQSLRLAVDALSQRVIVNANGHELAWQSLGQMKEFALPYLEERLLSTAGPEREQLQVLTDQLRSTDPNEQPPFAARRWPLIVLGLALLAAASGVVLVPWMGLVIAPVLAWMLLTGRAWINRLVHWHAVQPPSPKGFPVVLLLWSIAVAVPLGLSIAASVLVISQWMPWLFEAEAGSGGWSDGLGFVVGNLLNTQMFFDLFGPLGLQFTHLEPVGFLGGLLTLIVRVIFDVSLMGLIVSFVVIWYNRVVRGFAVTPNAELSLRQEALDGDEQSPRLIGHYYREIKAFLLAALKKQDNTPLLAPLACCGFYPEYRSHRPPVDGLDEKLAAFRLAVGTQLSDWNRLRDAEADLRQAVKVYQTLVESGRLDLRLPLARALRTLAVLLDSQQQINEGKDMKQAALIQFRQFNPSEVRTEFLPLLTPQEIEQEIRQALLGYESYPRASEKPHRIEMAQLRAYLTVFIFGQGRFEEAVREGQKVVAEVEAGRVSENDITKPLATCYLTMALAYGDRNEFDLAVSLYHQAARLFQRLIQLGFVEEMVSFDHVMKGLQVSLMIQGKLDEAEKAGREGLEVTEGLVRGGRLELRPSLAMARFTFAVSMLEWKPSEAESQARQAVELYERLLKEDPARDLLGPLITTRIILASVLNLQGRPGEGGALARKSLVDLRRWVATGQAPLPLLEAALIYELGTSYLFAQRPAQAEKAYRAAALAFDRLPPEAAVGQEQTGVRILTGLVEALLVQGRLAQAETLLDQLAASMTPLIHGGRSEMRCDLAGVHLLRGLTWLRLERTVEGKAELELSQGLFRTLFEEGQTQQLRFAMLLLEAVLPTRPLDPVLTNAAFEVMVPLMEEYVPRKPHWPEPALETARRFLKRAISLGIQPVRAETLLAMTRPSRARSAAE